MNASMSEQPLRIDGIFFLDVTKPEIFVFRYNITRNKNISILEISK